MSNELEERFIDKKGCLKSSEMRDPALRYQLKKLMKQGKVHKARHGFYVYADYLQMDEHVLVAQMIPAGVFCLFTAWHIHELSTTVPHQYHLALPRTTKISAAGYPPLAFHYLSKQAYETGIAEKSIEGQQVKCYDLERSVCDAVKFRNKTGEDIMQEVLKNYMQRSNKNLNKLLHYANILRIEKTIFPYLKALI